MIISSMILMKKLARNTLFFLTLLILLFFSSYKPVSEEGVLNSGGTAIAAENDTHKTRTQIGVASWYGADWHGKKTASGKRFNMYDHTAAHKSLPLGTVARVTNLENGKHVVVKINDRGPYKKGRIIDLSRAAAKSIGMLKDGTIKVKVEVIAMPNEKGNMQADNKS